MKHKVPVSKVSIVQNISQYTIILSNFLMATCQPTHLSQFCIYQPLGERCGGKQDMSTPVLSPSSKVMGKSKIAVLSMSDQQSIDQREAQTLSESLLFYFSVCVSVEQDHHITKLIHNNACCFKWCVGPSAFCVLFVLHLGSY